MKNTLTTWLVGIGAFIIIGCILIIILTDRDPTIFVTSFGALIAVVVSNGLIGNRLEKVSRNVNGNTHRLLEDNDRLRKLAGLREGEAVERRDDASYNPPLLSEDTLTRIADDNDKLPSHRA